MLITDLWSAYRNKIVAFAKQKCCTHLLRDIKKLLDKDLPKYPESEVFLKTLKKLIQDAIFLHNATPLYQALNTVLTVKKFANDSKDYVSTYHYHTTKRTIFVND